MSALSYQLASVKLSDEEFIQKFKFMIQKCCAYMFHYFINFSFKFLILVTYLIVFFTMFIRFFFLFCVSLSTTHLLMAFIELFLEIGSCCYVEGRLLCVICVIVCAMMLIQQ